MADLRVTATMGPEAVLEEAALEEFEALRRKGSPLLKYFAETV